MGVLSANTWGKENIFSIYKTLEAILQISKSHYD